MNLANTYMVVVTLAMLGLLANTCSEKNKYKNLGQNIPSNAVGLPVEATHTQIEVNPGSKFENSESLGQFLISCNQRGCPPDKVILSYSYAQEHFDDKSYYINPFFKTCKLLESELRFCPAGLKVEYSQTFGKYILTCSDNRGNVYFDFLKYANQVNGNPLVMTPIYDPNNLTHGQEIKVWKSLNDCQMYYDTHKNENDQNKLLTQGWWSERNDLTYDELYLLWLTLLHKEDSSATMTSVLEAYKKKYYPDLSNYDFDQKIGASQGKGLYVPPPPKAEKKKASRRYDNDDEGTVYCCDGTISPTCTYPHQGCCSWHGGICG